MPRTPPAAALSVRNARPFFELALVHGVRSGLIGPDRLAAMRAEGAKGVVQIAHYFATEYLRPELELARERFINLISLHLRQASGGDLDAAARLLAAHSLLSRSKAGADWLKALIVMPQATHFGMNEHGGFAERHIPQLARWSLASWDEVEAEQAARTLAADTVQVAFQVAADLGLEADDLIEAEPDAEAVIRSALLLYAAQRTEWPDWRGFLALVGALRRIDAQNLSARLALPSGVAQALSPGEQACVAALTLGVRDDLPRILNPRMPPQKLFDQSAAFSSRYFWREDPLSEVVAHERRQSAQWDRLTDGHDDDGTVLTVLTTLAAGVPARALLSEKQALALIRQVRSKGFHPGVALQYVRRHAPAAHQAAFEELWRAFSDEAAPLLCSDQVGSLNDALALLKRECNVA